MAGPIHSFNSINLLFRMGRLIENWIGMKGQRPQENSPAHEMGCCSRGDWFVNGICFLFLSFWWVKGGCWPHCSAKKREQNKKQMEWRPSKQPINPINQQKKVDWLVIDLVCLMKSICSSLLFFFSLTFSSSTNKAKSELLCWSWLKKSLLFVNCWVMGGTPL